MGLWCHGVPLQQLLPVWVLPLSPVPSRPSYSSPSSSRVHPPLFSLSLFPRAGCRRRLPGPDRPQELRSWLNLLIHKRRLPGLPAAPSCTHETDGKLLRNPLARLKCDPPAIFGLSQEQQCNHGSFKSCLCVPCTETGGLVGV